MGPTGTVGSPQSSIPASLKKGIRGQKGTLTALRMTMVSAVLVVYLAVRRRKGPPLASLSRRWTDNGARSGRSSVLFATALERLPAGAASLLFALVPAATALWMRLLVPARFLGGRAGLGLGIASTGAVLVALNCTPDGADASASGLGIGLIVGAVVVASFHGVYAKRHATHPPLEVMAPQILIGTMVLLAPGLLSRTMDWQGLSLGAWAVVAYLAVGVTVVPTAVLFWLFKRTSALKVALVNYLFPVVALVVGVVWFGERLSGKLAVGGVVLLLGVAMVETGGKGLHLNHAGLRLCPDLVGIPIEQPVVSDLHPARPDRHDCEAAAPSGSTSSRLFVMPEYGALDRFCSALRAPGLILLQGHHLRRTSRGIRNAESLKQSTTSRSRKRGGF